ncbi:energy transducer TonB [Sphingoaurantiacus capsulatus]|uniref:Energy transducer TonB n=1 Tax=Sphingoaurantiacus capsulatus TaxID=1771310 RepID=A0ABV7XDC8_9SPHN
MAFADEKMSGARMTSLGVVVILHVFLGYALISGLALKAVKVVTGPLETFEVEEPKIEEEPPPPPPEMEEIPPYVPPPEVVVETVAPPPPPITIQTTVPTPDPPRVIVAPPPPAPPARPDTTAQPIGNRSKISQDDYPDASIRAEEAGVAQVAYDVSVDGRASNCRITKSSGFPRLDTRTCELIERRFRFRPATSNGTPVPEAGKRQTVRWQLEER